MGELRAEVFQPQAEHDRFIFCGSRARGIDRGRQGRALHRPKDREHGYYVLKGYSDSESAVCISKMSTLLRKVRHIELRAAFLQELVAKGRFTVEHVPGAINPADSLTKSPTPSTT